MAEDEKALSFRVKAPELEEWYHKAFAEGQTVTDISRSSGRAWETVYRHLNTRKAKDREKEIHEELFREARSELARGAGKAAKGWLKQIELANEGQRANHLPAKDLLTHSGAIDIAVPNQDKGTTINIHIGTPETATFAPTEDPPTIDVTPK